VFGDLDKFLRWRVGLMERAIEEGCDFITTDSIVQVHDYAETSMFSMSSITRRASKSTIQLFSDYYPELLATKFFVNVPRVLAWVFGAISNFLSKETVEKFVVLGDARELNRYIDHDQLPERYGGTVQLVASPQRSDEPVAEVTNKVQQMNLNESSQVES
jgi:phosphatidylinositol transfer protein SFH5